MSRRLKEKETNRNRRIKKEVIDKFINHIPSLKQEVREEKINKILK